MRGSLLEQEGRRRSGQHNAHGDDHGEEPRVGDSRAFDTVRDYIPISMPLYWLALRRFEIEIDGILFFLSLYVLGYGTAPFPPLWRFDRTASCLNALPPEPRRKRTPTGRKCPA